MSSSLLRAPTEADAPAIAALFVEAFGDWRPMDAEEITTWLANEELPAENIRVLEVDGRVVGYADIWIDHDVELDMAAPGHWETMLDWAEQRGRDEGLSGVRAFFPEGHDLEQLLETRGYHYWRSAFVMLTDLEERPDAPTLPDGLELRSYRDEDAESLRAGLNAAFAAGAFWHDLTAGTFRESLLRQRGFDASLWLLAWDGAELAGFVLAFPCRGSDETTGWIRNLGVLPAYRRRGLGGALLRNGFRVLYDRGLRRAGLGVDAENSTGAIGLYERAGMRPVLRQDNWVKAL